MVKGGGFPTAGLVTGAAILAKLTFMGIILGMAGRTFNRCGFEIGSSAGFSVTIRTGPPGVLAFQLKSHQAVVKTLADGFLAIVAAHAIRSIGLDMGLHEARIGLFMAGAANSLIKTGNIIGMTIRTRKSQPIATFLVRP